MRIPKQAPSVDRSVNIMAQVANHGSVAASGWGSILGKVVRGAAKLLL